MTSIKLLWVLIIFLFVVFQGFDLANAAEIDEFTMDVKIDKEKIFFSFDGNFIGNTSNPTFIIGQGGYFSQDYSCTIANKNCIITPNKIDITIGPEEHLLPNGSIVISDPSISNQINSPAFINFPENTEGYFSLDFSILNIIKKQKRLYHSFLELDKKEEYTVDQFDLLQTRTPIEVKYISIQIPENYIISDDSIFSYYNICGTPGICETSYKFKKLKDNSYTLENVSYSDKPYVSGLMIPPYHFINLKLSLERSEEFIIKYRLIAVLTPFLILITFFISSKFRKSKLIGIINISPPAIYIFLRTYYLKLDIVPLHVEDIYFIILLIISIVLIEYKTRTSRI